MLDLLKLKEAAVDETEDAHVCKGLFYQGWVSVFIDKRGGYTYQERMVPLKRLSCPGNESRDFETGHIDTWDMEFMEVEDEEVD